MARAQGSASLPRRRSVALERMPVTTVIVAINVLVFASMVLSGVSITNPTTMDIAKWGANTGLSTILSQPWRMLTSNYVHIGLLHIAFNMWCLWNLGALAEQIFDRWAYFLTYSFCGIAGSMASVGLASVGPHPYGVSAGASGAIFGLAGALISALYLGRLPVHPSALKSTLKSLLSFAGYNLFFGAVVPGIDNSAHIGGLMAGLALGAVLAPRLTASRDERSAWQMCVFVVSALLLLLLYYFLHRVAIHLEYPARPF